MATEKRYYVTIAGATSKKAANVIVSALKKDGVPARIFPVSEGFKKQAKEIGVYCLIKVLT